MLHLIQIQLAQLTMIIKPILKNLLTKIQKIQNKINVKLNTNEKGKKNTGNLI